MKHLCSLCILWLWTATAALAQQRSPETVATRTVMVPMRDGIKLATDIYRPEGTGPWPVVLLRTPYDKSKTGSAGQNAARLGYAIVIQDTRGRFASEGENLPFNIDDRDGYDTVEWIDRQAWCNGKIGTFGGSALGITQLQLAGSGTRKLACQHITVAGPSLYHDVVYNGGAFRKSLVEDWLRMSQFSPKALELWTGHSVYDQYWKERDVNLRYSQVNAPAVHIGGYFDIFAHGTIQAFLGYQNKGGPNARGKQKLLMGPWTHGVLTDRAGDLVFPGGKSPPNQVQDQLRWWEYYLKGVVNGVSELPAVTYYVMGDTSSSNAPGNVWRTAAAWPPLPTDSTRWYLHPDQRLAPNRPATGHNITYLSDPKNPVPTLGGYQLTIPPGPKDQRPIEERADVVVFTSDVLSSPLEVIGQARARLYISSDALDTDFLVRLCDVYPDGRSMNICEGILRARFRNSLEREESLVPGKIYSLEIALWPTSIIFNRGHRLRVHVTSSSAPAYDPNPNTEEPLRWSNRQVIAANTVYVSRPYFSYLELPVVRGGAYGGN